MATHHEIIGEEWKERSRELAEWTMQRMVNRKDVWGQYSVLSPDERRRLGQKYKAMTLPRKSMRGDDMVTLDKLTRHFASRYHHKPQIIGLHEKSKEDTSLWLGIDIDCHDYNSPSGEDHGRRNLATAIKWWKEMQSMGYDPLLIDSSGKGGYHLWLHFAEPAPTQDVFALAQHFVSTWEENNLDEEPETFPKQLKPGSLGAWFRLPGLHHYLKHYGRVWSGDDWLENPWLEGHAAIDAILQCVPGRPPPAAKTSQEKHVRTTSRRKKTSATTATTAKTKKTAQQRKQRFKRSKRPVVCVDVDGVLASREYSKGAAEIGEPIDGAVDFTRELHETADIIILTARISGGDAKSKSKKKSAEVGEQAKVQVKDWLDQHGFAYTSIWTESGKPIASVYVDDRAVACRPEEDGVKAFKLAHEGIDKLL